MRPIQMAESQTTNCAYLIICASCISIVRIIGQYFAVNASRWTILTRNASLLTSMRLRKCANYRVKTSLLIKDSWANERTVLPCRVSLLKHSSLMCQHLYRASNNSPRKWSNKVCHYRRILSITPLPKLNNNK